MKNPLVYLIFLTLLVSCRQKTESIDSVYDYISYLTKTSSSKTGPVTVEIISGHLVVFGKSVAVITKSEAQLKIEYYTSGSAILSSGESIIDKDYQEKLDTTFKVSEKEFVRLLADEEELYKTRPIYDEVSVFIKVKRGVAEQDFRSRHSGGLTTIFKYNKLLDKDGRP